MKKTTKFLLVLAAVVAMTIGAVSTVMAANDVPVVATWKEEDAYYGWDAAGNQITNGWAVDAAGRWYYFVNKKALQDQFITYRGELYYFGRDAIMCEGWVKFTEDIPTILDVDRYCDGYELLDGDKTNPYGRVVWMYFKKGGAAAANEWVDVNGLWYYFEENIMVTDTYAYMPAGEDVVYGFSGNGNMHVGWIKVSAIKNYETPFEGSAGQCWLYYNTDGSMANAGWKKVDGKWYYFTAYKGANAAGKDAFSALKLPVGANILVTNYFGKLENGDKIYYLNSNGEMQTSEVSIAKDTVLYTTTDDFLAGVNGGKLGAKYTYLFDGNGVQITGSKNNNYYNVKNSAYKLKSYDWDEDELIGSELVGLGVTIKVKDDDGNETVYATISGEKRTNVFVPVFKDGKLKGVQYYDGNGTLVKSDLVTFGGITVAFDSDGYAITKPSTSKGTYVAGRYYYFDASFGVIDINGTKLYGCSTKKPVSTATGSAISVN